MDGRQRNIPGWGEIDWAHVERMRAEYPPLVTDHLVVDAIEVNLQTVRAALAE